MRMPLTTRWIDKLVSLPETGAGYQIVDLLLRDGRRLRRVMVFNAEEAEITDQTVRTGDIVDIQLSDQRHH